MNKALKAVIWVVVIVVILWLIGAAMKSNPMQGGNNAVSGNTYKVGVMVPLTGDAAVYGEPARNIYQIAVDEINAAGGVGGKNLELVVEDSKCNGKDAANAAQKLVNVDKVQVILGGFCSGESLAAIPVAEAGKVALFSPGSSSPDLTGRSLFFFRNYPSDSSQGSVIAQVAYDQGRRKVAFLQEQTEYPLGIYKAFAEKFEALGGKIVKEEFPSTSKDFRSQIAKIKAEKPDAFFVDTQTPAASDVVLQQLADSGWKIPVLLNDATMGDPTIIEKHKKVLEGAISAQFGVDPANPKFVHLQEVYKAKYGIAVPYQSYAQTEYDAVYMVRDAILAVGYDGEKIAAWGHSLTGWEGASGSITIGSNGDRASGHKPETVKDGKVVPYVK